MTAATLRSHTAKNLAQMARQNGVAGWHAMRKEELIGALVQVAQTRAISANHGNTNGASSVANGSMASGTKNGNGKNGNRTKKTNPQIRRKLEQLQRKLATAKNLASKHSGATHREPKEDRLVVMVRDPYWLHAFWELSQGSVDRARAAMGQAWHTAQPTLRVYRIKKEDATLHERDIAIHGGVCNWYVDVNDPPSSFRMEIGYLAANGSFYCLARSNTVLTPPASTSDAVDDNWADVAQHADRIFAMSGGYSAHGTSRELQELLEERLRRPMGTPMNTRYGNGAGSLGFEAPAMTFAVDAEVIVYGAAERDAHVTLKGEPVQLRADGTFAVRMSLPDRRQVIPIVASSSDGVEQQTIILAIERNTKSLETVVREIAR